MEVYYDQKGRKRVRTYLKEKYLGKGGFAYCMQVKDLDDVSVDIEYNKLSDSKLKVI